MPVSQRLLEGKLVPLEGLLLFFLSRLGNGEPSLSDKDSSGQPQRSVAPSTEGLLPSLQSVATPGRTLLVGVGRAFAWSTAEGIWVRQEAALKQGKSCPRGIAGRGEVAMMGQETS